MWLLAALPLGFFIIGDNAYPASENLVPVFGGADHLNPDNDNLNYSVSHASGLSSPGSRGIRVLLELSLAYAKQHLTSLSEGLHKTLLLH